MVYQVSIEYDGIPDTFNRITRPIELVLELLNSQYDELPQDKTNRGYGTERHLFYLLRKRVKALKFRDELISRDLAKTVHIDEIE